MYICMVVSLFIGFLECLLLGFLLACIGHFSILINTGALLIVLVVLFVLIVLLTVIFYVVCLELSVMDALHF